MLDGVEGHHDRAELGHTQDAAGEERVEVVDGDVGGCKEGVDMEGG